MKRICFAAVLFLSAGSVFADIIPTPPIDPCTVETQKKDGEECKVCTGEKSNNACQDEARKLGLEERCTSPAAGGSEIWCGAPVAAKSEVPAGVVPPQKRGVCAVEPVGDGQNLWLLAGLFGAALYFRKRRGAK